MSSFDDAVDWLNAGQKVRRSSWRSEEHLALRTSPSVNNLMITIGDAQADDWELVPPLDANAGPSSTRP